MEIGADLRDLLSAWMGHEIDPARTEELRVRLIQDEAFRREFVSEIRMLGMLKVVQSPEPRWLRLEDELGWSAVESPAIESFEDRIVRLLAPVLRPRSNSQPRRRAVVMVAVLMAAGLLATFWRKPLPPQTAPRPQPPIAVNTTTGLAMVVKLVDVSWEPAGQAHPAEGDLLGAGRLQFAAGRARLTMLTGVVLDIEGPADLMLIDSDRVQCDRGRIRLKIPKGAEGFRILGPSAAVVDLGTEFGLNVGTDGKTRGQVFKGRLEAGLLNAAGTLERSFFLDAAGANGIRSFEIDSRARQIEVVAPSEDFVSSLNPVTPNLSLDAEYAAAILQSRPWSYWRFQSMEGGTVPNEVAGRPPLLSKGPIRLGVEPAGNHWAEFQPTDRPQYLVLSELWQPTWKPGYAVEFWCLPESISHASLASLVSPRDTYNHVFLMELTSRNRLTIHKPASLRLLHRSAPSWEGGDNAYSENPYVPYRWHHFVGQINANRMELFMDGKLSSSLSIPPDHAELPCQFILGRLTTMPGTGLSIDRPFVGCLDDVAIYDRTLTPAEIRDHHRRGAGLPDPR